MHRSFKPWGPLALACVLALGWTAAAQAEDVAIVGHVKIISDKNPDDVSSPEAWKQAYIKEGMSDQDKAIAIWRTVVKYRYQDNPPDEYVQGGQNVHEPFKTFNIYGYGMCCCAAADIEGLARYIGLPARGRIINNHSVPEVWYGNSWHLLDASLMFYLLKPDGQIASVDDMKADIMAWRKEHPELKNDNDLKKFAKDLGWKKNGPPLFATCQFYDKDGINSAGWHGWWSNMTEYNYKVAGANKIVVPPDTQGEVNVYDYGPILGYQVNVELREGEKLTRRWYATEAATGLNRNDKHRYEKFLAGDMSALGLQKQFGDLSPGRVGNGTLEYDAMADSKLAADALEFDNLKMEGGALRIVDAAKPATLVIHMPSSYLYLDGQMTINPVVEGGGWVKASISLNNGWDWIELAKYDKSGPQQADLKPRVFNKYDYRVKLEFAGPGSGLDGLKLVNNVQCSQAALPLITEGDNKLSFCADPVAEGTVMVEGNMNGPVDTGKMKIDGGTPLCIGDFHPIVDGMSLQRFAVGSTSDSDAKAGQGADVNSTVVENLAHGTAIVPISTPGDITRIRMGVHWRARNPLDGYIVSVSFDAGKSWKEMGKLDLANPAKTTYWVFSDVPAGSRSAQVKFDGAQKNAAEIFDLRIDADYKELAGGFRPVKVTYQWQEDVPDPSATPHPTEGWPAKAWLNSKESSLGYIAGKFGTPKTAEHVFASPRDTWTLHCGSGTVARSYTVELAK